MPKWLILVATVATVGCGAARAPIAGPRAPAQTFLTTPEAQTALRQAFARAYYAMQQTGGGGITPSGGRPAGAGGDVSGPIRFPDGTAAAPAIAFTAEPGTGLRRSAANTLLLDLSGSDAYLWSNGSVGFTIHQNLPLQWGSTGLSTPDVGFSRGGAGKLTLTGTTPMLQLGGTTASFPGLKQSSALIQVRLADDSGFAPIVASTLQGASNIVLGNNVTASATTPTISSGFGTSPSVVAGAGTWSFRVNVGTGGVATSGVVGLSTATTGWNCQVTDTSTNVVTRQTANTTATVTVTAASAWAASDILIFNCAAY